LIRASIRGEGEPPPFPSFKLLLVFFMVVVAFFERFCGVRIGPQAIRPERNA
jgi:hypothetical protein